MKNEQEYTTATTLNPHKVREEEEEEEEVTQNESIHNKLK